MSIQSHYPCNCCSTCQYQIQTLQTKYNLLATDYKKLLQKDKLNTSVSEIYKSQNLQLNKLKIEQQAKLKLINDQYQQIKANVPQSNMNIDRLELENDVIRKQKQKISNLNMTINKKNNDIIHMKEQLQAKNNQLSKIIQNNSPSNIRIYQNNNNTSIGSVPLFNQNSYSNNKIYRQINMNKTLGHNDVMQMTVDTKGNKSYFQIDKNINKDLNMSIQKFDNTNTIQNLNKIKNINMIQSKILQLQQENNKLRRILTTKI